MDNPFSLSGKTILVTGASSGIGRQTCVSIAGMGGAVIASARNEERLNETFSMMPSGNHRIIKADLSDSAEFETLVNDIEKIDGIVHSAGIAGLIPHKFYKKDSLRHFNEINYEAPVLLTSSLLKNRKVVGGSSIIFISSISSQIGIIGWGPYSGTKGALMAITKVLALELAEKKIRVNCISPGLVKTSLYEDPQLQKDLEVGTQLHPLGLGRPEDVANACVFLLSDASRWITGSDLIIDGGYTAK